MLSNQYPPTPHSMRGTGQTICDLWGEPTSDLAPLRINPGNVKRCAIRPPEFYWFSSLNQGLQFSTE